MSHTIVIMPITYEQDVVAVRQRTREVARLVGFEGQGQTRLATAVSEIARNALRYATEGLAEFAIEGKTVPQILLVRVLDRGPGIPALQDIIEGRYRSTTGMGLGILGARRLVDQFQIESSPRGTVVWLRKLLPRTQPLITPARLGQIAGELARRDPPTPLEELRHQNQELLQTLGELRMRQDDLERLNHELEDTNRGVVALYAELDERADHLRRADELKSRFLSDMSHEFRTPLNAIRALTHVLLERMDGPLTEAQETQLGYIRKAADDLSEIVDDLLDLAKVEAGKVTIRPAPFEVADLFSALRGMLRPMLVSESVALVFDDPQGLPSLNTDEGKVSQILRNLVSNALKFTERGEVRVSAAPSAAGRAVIFAVADTGIGIAPEDQDRIFQQFNQLETPVQKRVRGTGLGLPLSRRLAHLLGGSLSVRSQPGIGSTFYATIPVTYAEPSPEPPTRSVARDVTETPGLPLLIVEDRPEDLLLYEKFLRGSGFQIVPAATLEQARQALRQLRPVAIVLDILLHGQDAWGLVAELKRNDETRDIPLLVATTVDDERKGLALGADAYAVKPIHRRWLLETLRNLVGAPVHRRVLVIDDDEAARYLLRDLLDDISCVVAEAATGAEGLRRAHQDQADVIFLDLVLPDMTGHTVLERLKTDPLTRQVPVIVLTSKALDDDERALLVPHTLDIMSKASPRALAVATIRAAFTRAGLLEGAV